MMMMMMMMMIVSGEAIPSAENSDQATFGFCLGLDYSRFGRVSRRRPFDIAIAGSSYRTALLLLAQINKH